MCDVVMLSACFQEAEGGEGGGGMQGCTEKIAVHVHVEETKDYGRNNTGTPMIYHFVLAQKAGSQQEQHENG